MCIWRIIMELADVLERFCSPNGKIVRAVRVVGRRYDQWRRYRV